MNDQNELRSRALDLAVRHASSDFPAKDVVDAAKQFYAFLRDAPEWVVDIESKSSSENQMESWRNFLRQFVVAHKKPTKKLPRKRKAKR